MPRVKSDGLRSSSPSFPTSSTWSNDHPSRVSCAWLRRGRGVTPRPVTWGDVWSFVLHIKTDSSVKGSIVVRDLPLRRQPRLRIGGRVSKRHSKRVPSVTGKWCRNQIWPTRYLVSTTGHPEYCFRRSPCVPNTKSHQTVDPNISNLSHPHCPHR